jgi:hypothetical protein
MSKLRYRVTLRDADTEDWVVAGQAIDGPGKPMSGEGTPKDIVMRLYSTLDEPFDIDATKMWLDDQSAAAHGAVAKLPLGDQYQLEVVTLDSS